MFGFDNKTGSQQQSTPNPVSGVPTLPTEPLAIDSASYSTPAPIASSPMPTPAPAPMPSPNPFAEASPMPFLPPTPPADNADTTPPAVTPSYPPADQPMVDTNADTHSSTVDHATADLLNIKQHALQQLSPIVSHLDQSAEERFKTTMMMIQASDDQSLLPAAYDAANAIEDEKVKAQALLDIVNEINYFTQHHNQG